MGGPASSVTELVALLGRLGGVIDPDLGSEQVDLLAHSLQCADALEAAHPDDIQLQVAGLVHDVGHVLAPGANHARVGGDHVRDLLGDRVANLVELHVPAKRYLVTTDVSYRAELNPTSLRSFELQGGLLTPDERAELERSPHLNDAVTLRRADEAAKTVGQPTSDLGRWVPLLERAAAMAPPRS